MLYEGKYDSSKGLIAVIYTQPHILLSFLQEALPPELVNQASVVSGDPTAAGDTAPAAGELKFAPSANDPGAFVSPAVEADGVMSHHRSKSHPLL